MDLRIAFLYPELMNIYGDRGNIIAMSSRARWSIVADTALSTTITISSPR